jgi:hypothetical protein
MNLGPMIAVGMSIFTASMLAVFLWVAEVRARWKAGAVFAFSVAMALLFAGGSPLVFVAGLSLQTLLAISLSLYLKVEF